MIEGVTIGQYDLKVRLNEQRAALKVAKLETALIDTERRVLLSDQENREYLSTFSDRRGIPRC